MGIGGAFGGEEGSTSLSFSHEAENKGVGFNNKKKPPKALEQLPQGHPKPWRWEVWNREGGNFFYPIGDESFGDAPNEQ